MKVIDLGNRVIFADNIKSIYQDIDNWNNDKFHIETKDNENYCVVKAKYYEVKEYLLSSSGYQSFCSLRTIPSLGLSVPS